MLAVVAGLIGTMPVRAQGIPEVRILEHGRYSAEHERVTTDPAYGVTGVSPMRIADDIHLVETTDRVEARICERFGIMFAAPGLPAWRTLPVTIRVRHPLIVRPDGVQSELETWRSALGRERAMSGFDFNEPWELVPGTWTIEVVYRDEVLASQRFDVVPASRASRAGGRALEDCGVPVS